MGYCGFEGCLFFYHIDTIEHIDVGRGNRKEHGNILDQLSIENQMYLWFALFSIHSIPFRTRTGRLSVKMEFFRSF